jgi:hypothetical protein
MAKLKKRRYFRFFHDYSSFTLTHLRAGVWVNCLIHSSLVNIEAWQVHKKTQKMLKSHATVKGLKDVSFIYIGTWQVHKKPQKSLQVF